MKRKKRAVADQRSPTEDELYDGISKMKEPYRSYAAFSYLFGNRVSEALGKRVKNAEGKFEYEYPPLERWRLSTWDNGWMSVDIITLKRRGRPRHTTFVLETGPGEKRFVDLVSERLRYKKDYDPIWEHSRISQWRHMEEKLGISPHKLRNLRATKDVIVYDLDTASLQKKFNWARAEMAIHYTSLNQKDIMRKMERAVSQGNG